MRYSPFICSTLTIVLLLLFVAIPSELFAQQESSLLWEISGKNLSQPSYLYGTMHSEDERVHQLGDSVLNKLYACDAVALELIMDMEAMQGQALSMLQMLYMTDTLLEDLVNEADYKLIKSFARKKLGVMSVFLNVNKIKPIFTATLLSDFESQKKQKQTLDMYLQEIGKQTKKKLIGIETIEEQLSALDAIPLSEQADMLLQQVHEDMANKNAGSSQQLMDNYLSQDLDALYAFYKTQSASESSNFDAILLTQRNYTMAKRMDSVMQQQATFNAVGALHLPGKEGVIKLLRERGYTVQPVVSQHTGLMYQNLATELDEWYEVSMDSYACTVRFPEKPKRKKRFSNSAKRLSYQYADVAKKIDYRHTSLHLNANNLPKSTESLFDSYRSKNWKGKILTSEQTSISGRPAEKGVLQNSQGQKRHYLLVHDKDTLHVLFVDNKMGKATLGNINHFFYSLRL